MKHYPISKDSRYCVQKEYCGHAKPMFVLRFCGDFICSSSNYSACVIRAVGHNAERMGSPVIVEKTT